MTKRRAAAFIFISVVASCGCTTPRQPLPSARLFAEATPLCVVLDNPKSYVGKDLLVRGYLSQTPHGRDFRDDGCKRGYLPLELSPDYPKARQLSLLLSKSNRRPPQVYAVYKGKFADRSPTLVCHALCSEFVLESAELVAVRAD